MSEGRVRQVSEGRARELDGYLREELDRYLRESGHQQPVSGWRYWDHWSQICFHGDRGRRGTCSGVARLLPLLCDVIYRLLPLLWSPPQLRLSNQKTAFIKNIFMKSPFHSKSLAVWQKVLIIDLNVIMLKNFQLKEVAYLLKFKQLQFWWKKNRVLYKCHNIWLKCLNICKIRDFMTKTDRILNFTRTEWSF